MPTSMMLAIKAETVNVAQFEAAQAPAIVLSDASLASGVAGAAAGGGRTLMSAGLLQATKPSQAQRIALQSAVVDAWLTPWC
jgi:hypothetical protein